MRYRPRSATPPSTTSTPTWRSPSTCARTRSSPPRRAAWPSSAARTCTICCADRTCRASWQAVRTSSSMRSSTCCGGNAVSAAELLALASARWGADVSVIAGADMSHGAHAGDSAHASLGAADSAGVSAGVSAHASLGAAPINEHIPPVDYAAWVWVRGLVLLVLIGAWYWFVFHHTRRRPAPSGGTGTDRFASV